MNTPFALPKQHQEHRGGKIGIRIFIFVELLIWTGLFLLYTMFRNQYAHDFQNASKSIYLLLGTINTFILLTSSLTMSLSMVAIRQANQKLCLVFLGFTIALGFAFLIIQYFEWASQIDLGRYPNSEWLQIQADGVILFYGIYYTMTGLYGLHVLAGIMLLLALGKNMMGCPCAEYHWDISQNPQFQGSTIAFLDSQGNKIWTSELDATTKQVLLKIQYHPAPQRIHAADYTPLKNAGLYWQWVSMIWLFLFPFFYLIR